MSSAQTLKRKKVAQEAAAQQTEQEFFREAANINYLAARSNVLAIAVIFIHRKDDVRKEMVRPIVLSPPTHKVAPNFVKDVFRFIKFFGGEIIPPPPPSDFYAHLFMEHMKKRHGIYSWFWITFAQFNYLLNSPYTSTQQIQHKRVCKEITLSTRYYRSLCWRVNEDALAVYCYAFVECWKIYGTLLLIDPLKNPPIIAAWHRSL